MKKYSASLDIRELEIKNMLRFYFILVIVATIKKTSNKRFREKSTISVGNVIGSYTLEISLKIPHKTTK